VILLVFKPSAKIGRNLRGITKEGPGSGVCPKAFRLLLTWWMGTRLTPSFAAFTNTRSIFSSLAFTIALAVCPASGARFTRWLRRFPAVSSESTAVDFLKLDMGWPNVQGNA
jgi:hypothetical protein